MPTSRKKMALLNGLDQYSAYYSVICVFGSVVGCVVVPLITQSIECIILSAIVISLTAKTIHSRSLAFKDDQQDDRRRGVTRDIGANDKKMKKKKLQSSVKGAVDGELVRRQRQEDLLRQQEQRDIEKQQKYEEKRLKKARKREEKMKQKEEEEQEKMKEARQRKEREEKRLLQKLKKTSGLVAPLESLDSLSRPPLAPRERKNSSSSSGSNRSSRSLPRPRPPRMSSHGAFARASSDPGIPSVSPATSPTVQLPPHLPAIASPPPPIDTLVQSLEGSKKKQTEDHTYRSSSLSPHNRSSNNNHSPQPTRTRQIVAVNPLAPSECVTTATSLNTTTCTATAALPKMMGSNWNAQLYYWSLHQAGLTRPIQYGWDPVAPPHNYGSRPLGRNLQLQQLQPGSSLWGQRGVFPAPATSVSSSSPAPPICSSFGAIGNLSTAPVPADSSSRQQQQRQLSQESAEREKIDSDGRGYSLFSGNGQTIFGGSLLNGQVSSGSGQPVSMTNGGNCTNEGGSPMKMRFDEWPAF